jgi:hypothetical protein
MEKDIAVESARPASPSSEDNNPRAPLQAQDPVDPKWQPGVFSRFPWIGIGSLLMILVCSAASVIVLVTSNHVSVSNWPRKIAPNVLLNIMSNIEYICFTVAIGKLTKSESFIAGLIIPRQRYRDRLVAQGGPGLIHSRAESFVGL